MNDSTALLELRDLRKAFDGKPVLNGVSMTVDRGQACVILGGSGEGKTTLLQCINLLLGIDAGEVLLGGDTVVRAEGGEQQVMMNPIQVRSRVGLVFQEWNLWPNMTVEENITFALRHSRKMNSGTARKLALELCEEVRLTDKLHVYPNSLSGGQKQRAAIARALAMAPEILMLDEVTSALDPVLATEVLDTITELKRGGRTLIVVTHHVDFARAVADKVIYLHGGKVKECGDRTILDSPQSNEMQWFLRQLRRTY